MKIGRVDLEADTAQRERTGLKPRGCYTSVLLSRVGPALKSHTAHIKVKTHENKDWTRKGRRAEGEAGQPQWRQNEGGRRRATLHAGTFTDTWHWATRGEHRGSESETHLGQETNCLPSALVAVPSLSKLKNKGRDNREQLVTVKKLNKQNVISYSKSKARVKRVSVPRGELAWHRTSRRAGL